MEQTFSIDGLIRSFTAIYEQFDKANVSVIENDLRKMVPSENSEVFFSSGADYTENSMGINATVINPLPIEQTQHLTFADIIKAYILKADVNKLAIVNRCIRFLENSWGDSYFIDGVPVHYNSERGSYYIHLVILKENKAL